MIRLTLVREERKWTRAKLSYRTEIHASDISKIEKGRLLPYDHQLMRIAKALEWPEERRLELLEAVSA